MIADPAAGRPIRVLLVDDDEDDWILARDALADIGPHRYEPEWAPTYEAGLAALQRAEHDVALLDYRLGEHDGLTLAREAILSGCRAPLILLTGAGEREVDEAAVRAGAADYLLKNRLDSELLDRAIRFALERRRAEERTLEVVRAEFARDEAEARHAELQNLLATISHDLQQPLSAIRGRAQLLQRQLSRADRPVNPQQIVDGLTQISESALRMADQLTELVTASRGDLTQRPMLDVRPTDLASLARRAAEEAQQATETHRVVVEAPPEPVIGEWDGGRLSRVLANLLSNAAKYSPRGGEILLRVGTDTDAIGRPRVVFAVTDHGIGIPQADLATVFEPFRRASNGARVASGSGIGLASVRQIVEQHGGEVRVESIEGAGSTFTVRLPLSAARVGTTGVD